MARALAWLAALALVAADTDPEGQAWLIDKGKEPGVVTLPSGLMYKVLRDGDGEAHPLASTSCSCHYEGTLTDGTVFDSSYERGEPTSFAPNQVIKGWTEAMQLMVQGDKWEMYIPSELGYGDRGSPPKIPGGAPLVFTMEIISIDGATKPAERCDPATKKGCSEREVAYIEKQTAKSADDRAKELKRLGGMKTQGTKPELKAWVAKRKTILEKMGEL